MYICMHTSVHILYLSHNSSQRTIWYFFNYGLNLTVNRPEHAHVELRIHLLERTANALSSVLVTMACCINNTFVEL